MRGPAGGLARWRSKVLLLSGLFVMAGVVVYNTLGLGYGAQYHGMPFVPVAVGLVAVAAGASDAFAVDGRRTGGRLVDAALAAGMLGLLMAGVLRLFGNSYAPAAFLWLHDFSRFHAAHFATQDDRPPLRILGVGEGAAPPGEGDAAALAALEVTLRERAAVIVVCTDTARYADPASVFVLYRGGAAMVDRLLDDPAFDVVHRFRVGSTPFAVLTNRALQ